MDMDMEQLKLILATLRDITGDAGHAAVWWMAMHYGVKVLTMLLIAGVIITALVLLIRVVRASSDADRLCRELARKLGVESFDTWYAPDRKALLKAIDEKLK